jgi:hypothetical protein
MSDNASSAPASAPGSDADDAGVDVHKLAEKVYRLLLADARLDAARGGKPTPVVRRREA